MTSTGRARPPLSVVIPIIRPHPVYFVEAVQSILEQTYGDFELIIVEDPSERNGEEMIRPLRDGRIRYVRNSERTSLGAQRNQGLHLARGDYLALMDGDDISEPERLEKQLRFLRRNPNCDVLGSHLLVITRDGKPHGYRSYPTTHEDIVHAMRFICPIGQPTVMLRRLAMLEAGGYRWEQYPVAEDFELWCRMAKMGMRFANYPEPLFRYRCHPEQAKARHLRDTIRAVVAIKQKYWRGSMGLKATLRIWAEQAMLWLPARLVWRLIYLAQYRDRRALPQQQQLLEQQLLALRDDDLASADLRELGEALELERAFGMEEPCLAEGNASAN